MENMRIYDAVREVPATAQKKIEGGRLKGMSDVNPMWRIKTLTEQFGTCGVGWKYEIAEKRLEPGANDEVAAFVDIKLYIKIDGEWSEAIPGTGGSSFVAKERSGLYTSDECFKMALTDAISVACKALGFGADVYWNKDRTKYSVDGDTQQEINGGAEQAKDEDTAQALARLQAEAAKYGFSDEQLDKAALAYCKKKSFKDCNALDVALLIKKMSAKGEQA